MATAEFSKFAGILSTALSQHHLSGFETALLEFHHLHFVPSDAFQGPLDFTFTFHFHALEKEMAIHSSVLAWRIPGTGEPGGLPSLGSHRVGHD